MEEIDTEVTLYDMVNEADYEGGYFAHMQPAGSGDWVSYAEHDRVVVALQDRITYLENVCDEQTRMLTGD